MVARRGPAIVLSLVLSAAALAIMPSAMAGDGGTVKDTTNCSDFSNARLKVELQPDNRFEVTGIVWSDDEDTWDWKFKHNGDNAFDGDVKAKDADKSFKIVRPMVNFAGPDSFVFRAQNRNTDEICRVNLVY